MAWNAMLSNDGFWAPQYWALRLSTRRRLGSKLSSAKGPVPTAAVRSALPSPPASFGMTPLYLPARFTRKVAAGVDLAHKGEVVGPGAHLGIADALVAVLDVLGVHLLAVVEPHGATQVEHVLGRRLLLPPLGQLRLGLERVVDPHQVLVEQRLAALPDVEALHVGLDAGRQRGAGERQRPARLGLRPGAPRHTGRRDGEGGGAAGEEASAVDRGAAAGRGVWIHGRSPSLSA